MSKAGGTRLVFAEEDQLQAAADAVAEAWEAFQNAGVMSQNDGRTGNEHLDRCASQLDYAAMLLSEYRTRKSEGT